MLSGAHGASMTNDSSAPFLVSASGTSRLTRMQTRHSRFTLTSRGVRMSSDEWDSDRARWLAAQLPLSPHVVLSHTTAALLHRLPLPSALQAPIPAHVSAPREVHRPRRRDLITHHASLVDEDVTELHGLRLTTVVRTYVDLAALLQRSQLVAVGDVVLRDHGVSTLDLHACAARRGHYPGRRRAIDTLDWLDPRAASPRESHLRVLLREARLPRPEVNAVIHDDRGGFLAVGDLVFLAERVIVEYDGVVHAPMRQRAKDASRRAMLREHGWIVVEIVGEDMRYPHRVVHRVRSALAQGAARHT